MNLTGGYMADGLHDRHGLCDTRAKERIDDAAIDVRA
jgi:hypothetical protein